MLQGTTLFSIAILNQSITISTLQNLIRSLKVHYTYFEVILINPMFKVISPPPLKYNDFINFSQLHNQTNLLEQPQLQFAPHLRILDVKAIDSSMYYYVFLQNCIGDYLLFMDLETQSIKDCLALLQKTPNYDIVVGVRTTKKQSLIQTMVSKAFYLIMQLCAKDEIQPTYSDFCVINRKVIHFLLKQDENIKLLRFITFDPSFKKYEYLFTPLKPDKPKKFLDAINLGIDIVFQNSYKLLRLATVTSLSMAVVNFLYMFYILLAFLQTPNIESGWTSNSLYMTLMQSCLFLTLAIFGEYMRAILLHFKRKDAYQIIDETSNITLHTNQKNIKDS